MDVIKKRRSKRDYDSHPLELQVLSNLLWAAYGTFLVEYPRDEAVRAAASGGLSLRSRREPSLTSRGE
jgi:hypothetical protein